MTSSIDRLDGELLCRTTIVREADRRVGLSNMWEIVWWLEPASRDPVDTRSLDVDRRHMHESGELCH